MKNVLSLLFFFFSLISQWSFAQAPPNSSLEKQVTQLQEQVRNLRYSFQSVSKAVDDIQWYNKIGDIAFIDKVELTGPPLGPEKMKIHKGAANPIYALNPLRIKAYVFIPKGIDTGKQYPLLVLPHGGVHSNFNTSYAHIVRELIAQQYVIVAPEYRGSTGYGKRFYESIDYGGLEIQDTKASRDFMLENYSFLDKDRVGILGWSHGGLITLMNLFEYPDAYKVGYAGVPVSDLIARMGYKTDGYRDLYSVDYHIGKTAHQDVEEYKRRSPAWQAHKLQTPLLVHTNTNDSDVNVLEVEHLIKSLQAADKEFEHQIYEDKPGGHRFDRMDTKFAKEVRLKVYQFLDSYLQAPKGFKSLRELEKASYGF
ncbi:MAG: prolyl oligopeptidase family serine peptidase [Bacteroidota bacterium]